MIQTLNWFIDVALIAECRGFDKVFNIFEKINKEGTMIR